MALWRDKVREELDNFKKLLGNDTHFQKLSKNEQQEVRDIVAKLEKILLDK